MLKKLSRLFYMPLAMRISLMTRITLLALNFVTAIVVARLYGAEATGQIALILAILAVTSVVSLGGFQMMALRHFAGKTAVLKTLFTAYLIRVAIGTLIVVLALQFVFIPLFGARFQDSLGSGLVSVLALISAVSALRIFLYETVRSREKIVSYSMLLLLGPIISLVLVLVLPRVEPSLSFAWIVAVSEIIGLAAVVLVIGLKGCGLGLSSISISDLKVKSRNYYVSSLSIMANSQDVLLVGTLVPVEQLGIYVIASRFAGLVSLPKTMAGISYAPEVARIHRDQGREAALTHTRKTTRTIVPVTLILAIVMVAAGPAVLDLLGAEFRAGYPVLVLLVAAHLILASIGHSGLLLMMAGHDKLQMADFLLSAAVMIVVLVVLVPQHGIIGGGIAMLASALQRSVFGTIAIRRVFGKGITAFHVYGQDLPPEDGPL